MNYLTLSLILHVLVAELLRNKLAIVISLANIQQNEFI